jgi:hypothetical protein
MMQLELPATALYFSNDGTVCYMQHIVILSGTLAEISSFQDKHKLQFSICVGDS